MLSGMDRLVLLLRDRAKGALFYGYECSECVGSSHLTTVEKE